MLVLGLVLISALELNILFKFYGGMLDWDYIYSL